MKGKAAVKYEKIILLGSGKLFLNCLEWVSHLEIPYVGYDTNLKEVKITKIQAENRHLAYECARRKEILEMLCTEKRKTLLLSIINPWILPDEVLRKENILGLNCHQALLPEHRGRNAECWSIFEGDKKTGITWHKMTNEIDGGEILLQKEIPIDDTTTSMKLFAQQLKMAYEAFTEFMPDVLEGKEQYRPQREGGGNLHLSTEIPAEGKLDLDWTPEKMSRFLRAMDYGILEVLGKPTVFVDGKRYTWGGYQITKTEMQETNFCMEKDRMTIVRPGYEIILKKCKEIVEM